MSDRFPDWTDKHYAFFCNKECEYFPCHPTNDPDNFNCLFCYCPLYALGKNCGGNPKFYGDVKDCSQCAFPHNRNNYGKIMDKFQQIVEVTKKIGELE
ncbi:MAG: cysteine-rich small domain-containing protein [Oscillospiraceae bacterium]|nr:cysteine-rich small domain-containing protein [Oscillospiraceae bacterium]